MVKKEHSAYISLGFAKAKHAFAVASFAKATVFAKAKDSSPRRRMSSWDKNASILALSLACFPNVINTILVIFLGQLGEDLEA